MTAKETTKKAHISVADYIKAQVQICGRPQTKIAEEAGFKQTNMISMLKAGKTKLPIERVSSLARALGVDARYLFTLTMREYYPEVAATFDELLQQPILTSNELEMVQIIRAANPSNPRAETPEQVEALKAFAVSLGDDTQTQ